MKVAVTYENGMIFQHFGKTRYMKIFDIDGDNIKSFDIVSMGENSHHSIASYIKELGVDTLICGGIGQGAVDALNSLGITIYAGNSGNADVAIFELLDGRLKKNSNANCTHHHDHHE